MKICTKIVNMSNIPILSAPYPPLHIRLGGTAYVSSSPRCDRQRPQEGVSTLLPRAPQRSYRERLCALTESASAFLPRASLRPYRERPCAPIMIVLVPSVKGGKPAPPSRSAKGAGPTPRDNNHVKSCCLTNISLTLVQESDLLVSVSVTGTDIMIALAVAYTPTGCTGSR
mgnify:CR=1 FL=1